ncbi:MAG TPA: methyltransferase domain-containing protein [Burkholderiales bacterium]|nr:methyltransferase domain-containing protein [Burkholderiales bacterium]
MAQDSSKADFWESRYRDHVIPWDAGKVPAALQEYLPRIRKGGRVLIPGCGSAYEAGHLAENGFDVLAIDFSPAAVELGKRNFPRFSDVVRIADFFDFDSGMPYDLVYERAFLCALPAQMWPQYAARVAQLLRPNGELAGFFFLKETEKGPPFGTSPHALHALLDPYFELVENKAVTDSIPVFQGSERWQVWRKR